MGGAGGERGRVEQVTMAMNGRDLFAKVDQQVSAFKERIARQREVIKRAKLRGHSTAAAETIQHTLHQSLHGRNAAGKSLSGSKRHGSAPTNRTYRSFSRLRAASGF